MVTERISPLMTSAYISVRPTPSRRAASSIVRLMRVVSVSPAALVGAARGAGAVTEGVLLWRVAPCGRPSVHRWYPAVVQGVDVVASLWEGV
jgi:hypothetical protein